jgi:hypothetical protein
VSPEHWLAIVAIMVTIAVPIIGALIAHIRHDERREARLTQVEQEIGTRSTGLRGAVHEHTNALTWVGGCVWMIAEKLGIKLPRREK